MRGRVTCRSTRLGSTADTVRWQRTFQLHTSASQLFQLHTRASQLPTDRGRIIASAIRRYGN
jgi:hypothetical protein